MRPREGGKRIAEDWTRQMRRCDFKCTQQNCTGEIKVINQEESSVHGLSKR